MKRLTIMRGLPGSGKSTLARSLANGAPVLSTDDFFVGEDGVYRFDGSRLAEFHAKNLDRAVNAMKAQVPHLVVDNTMTQAWEAREYVKAAVLHGYEVHFVEPTTPWAKDPAECAKRCQHGVPEDRIKAMLDRWEEPFTIERCSTAKAPWERNR